MTDDRPHIQVQSRADLRQWLGANHGRETAVWLVTYKKHHADYLDFGEVIEELMCWGWVDSSTRRVDDDRHMHLISPRNPDSAWSAANKRIVERMRAAGLMTSAGEAAVAAAIANGMWEFLDDVERLEVPPDLAAALDKAARTAWEAYPRSIRRAALEWVKRAKTPPTRDKRIAEIAAATRENRRPAPFAR